MRLAMCVMTQAILDSRLRGNDAHALEAHAHVAGLLRSQVDDSGSLGAMPFDGEAMHECGAI